MTKFYIVWNEAKNEGFITDDEQDALDMTIGRNTSSALGQDFLSYYEDEPIMMQVVELDP